MKIEKVRIRLTRPESGMPWDVKFPREFVESGGTWAAWNLEDALRLVGRILKAELGEPCHEYCAAQTFCPEEETLGHMMCGYCANHQRPKHHCKSKCWGI